MAVNDSSYKRCLNCHRRLDCCPVLFENEKTAYFKLRKRATAVLDSVFRF